MDSNAMTRPTIAKDNTFIGGVGASPLPPMEPGDLTSEKPTIAVMSFGEMGMGIASLLAMYSYPIVTNLDGRSEKTLGRANALDVKLLSIDKMVEEAAIFMSIVPPAESLPLAQKVAQAYQASNRSKPPLHYVDLNAISPELCKEIAKTLSPKGITFVDGAIIGFPPKELDSKTWFRPSIPVSGPKLSEIGHPWTSHLISLLKIRHIGDNAGDASGLKMCFGALYKGQAAITIQAYTTAHRMGVLAPLRQHMNEYFPAVTPVLESSLHGSQRKAYRWIKEMDEIAATFTAYGGWGPKLFTGVGDVFRLVAGETELEKESKSSVEEITAAICVPLQRNNKE